MKKNSTAAGVNTSVFLLMAGVGLIVAILPQKIMDISYSIADVGMLASAYALPNILLQLPIGRLADRFGFKFFITAGYLFCTISGLIYFYADSLEAYFFGRFLQGIAEIPIWALAPALLSLRYSSQKGRFMGIYNACLHLGLTSGGFLSIFASEIFDGNKAFLLFSLLSISGGLITFFCVKEPLKETIRKHERPLADDLLKLIFQKTNITVLMGTAVYGAGYGIFITIIPALLIKIHNASPVINGIYFSLFYISISISQLYGGIRADNRNIKSAMISGLLSASIGTGIFLKGGIYFSVSCLTFASLGLGLFSMSSMTFLNKKTPDSLKGSISGAFFLFWGSGYFAGPFIMGKMNAYFSASFSFLLFSIVIFIYSGLASFVIKKEDDF